MMDKGDTFLMRVIKGTELGEKHLWVVISDTKKHSGCGVIVNISKNKTRTGQECPLAANEHPWLDEPTSWLCYGDATLVTPRRWESLDEAITSGFIIPKEKCPDACLQKIISGAKASAAKPGGAFPKELLSYLD